MSSAEFKAVDAQYGIGSPFWTASSALTGLLSGVLGGNVQSGMAAGAAPVLARLVKEVAGKNEEARIALHTVISAALAKAQGGNATAGVIGGFIASAGANTFAQALYGKDTDQLNPDEKMVVLNLVTAVGAAGGGVASGDTSGMVSAGNAAKVEVENNSLGAIVKASEKALEACVKNPTCRGAMNQMGIVIGLTNAQIEEAMRAGASRDLAQIKKLTPQQIAYLDEQITSGKGMSREMFGSQTWGDRLGLPIADKDPTGGKLENTGHQGDWETTLTTPDQRDQSSSSNTGNNSGVPDTGGNTTVTPIPDGPNKDDLAYLSEKPLGLGSTGRTQANSLQEKLAMDQALSNPAAGFQLPIPMTDKRWPKEEGWVKMAQNINGVEIHYVRNTKTNQIDDFKFK